LPQDCLEGAAGKLARISSTAAIAKSIRAAEDHVRHGDEQCLFVDGFEQALDGHVNSVVT
jgi:hypothetical protein